MTIGHARIVAGVQVLFQAYFGCMTIIILVVGLLHATLVHYVDSGSGTSSTVHDFIADIRVFYFRTQREIILKYRIAQLKFIREPDSTATQHSRST